MSSLIDQITGGTLPETQPETSAPFLSGLHDPFKQDLISKSMLHHVPELKGSNKPIERSHMTSLAFSDLAADREAATCDGPIIKMIEVKQASDGLNVSYTGETLTLERAFQCGLIPSSAYMKILQKLKTKQDAAEDSSPSDSLQDIGSGEVTRLILKCFGRNKSLTSERDVHMLRLLGIPDGSQNVELSEDEMRSIGNVLKVDAAIQCDLMSFSSTLTLFGNQQQFMGLVLHPSGEVQTVPTSFQDDRKNVANKFTSSVFANREKIAAFYIPEFSEVVDFAAAVQNGLIDDYTAEVLDSLEIPDVLPDVDRLNERFSSWLMYKKLTIEGCYHAADCLQVDNVPSQSEATQLLISYLMINSYIDSKSGKRVLILDRELSKMLRIFLEDPTLSGNTERSATSLNVNVSQQGDLAILEHIKEETKEPTGNAQHARHPHDNFVSSVNGRMTFRDDDDMDTMDPVEAKKTVCRENAYWTESGEFAERMNENSLQVDIEGDSDGLDIPEVSGGIDSERSETSCLGTPLYFDGESLCSDLESTDAIEAEFLCRDDVLKGENERDYFIELVKEQMQEAGILGAFSDLEEALSAGLVDERTVLKLLESPLYDKDSTGGDEVSRASNIALRLMGQQRVTRSAGSFSISESFDSGLHEDEPVDSKVMGLVLTDQGVDSREKKSKKGNAEVDFERTGNVEKVMSYQHPPVDADKSGMISTSLSSQLTAECVHHTDKSPLLAQGSDSHGVIDSRLTDVGIEIAALTTLPHLSNPESKSQYASLTHLSKCDGSHFADEFKVGNWSSLHKSSSPQSDARALESDLHSEPKLSRGSTRVENALTSDSRGNCSADDKIRQSVLPSESVFSGGPDHGQRIPQSSIPSYKPTTSSISLEGFDVGVSEAATRASHENLLGSQRRATDDVGSGADRLSPEEQHGNIEQISVSRHAQCAEPRDEQSADNNGKAVEMSSDQSDVVMLVHLGSDTPPEEEILASECPQAVSNLFDFRSGSSTTYDVSSSAVISDAVLDHRMEITEVTDVSDWKQAPDVESTVSVSLYYEADVPQRLTESTHSDPPIDMLKQNTLILNNKGEIPELILQELREKTEKGDAHDILLHLQQVLSSVASSQDFSVIQEVMETLKAVEGNSEEEQYQTLQSFKEESSGGEAGDDSAQCTPQSSADSDACIAEHLKHKVHFMVFQSQAELLLTFMIQVKVISFPSPSPQLFSIHDYLECVGRLQDHSDVLDDVRKELLLQAPPGKTMDELQVQVEECQVRNEHLRRMLSTVV